MGCRVSSAIGTAEQPLRVAIIGSGPAGFYAAGQLLSHKEVEVEVEMFDRLPTPWGLVRAGVAPDHPKIKAVTRVYEKTAKLPGFRFHGNVEVGLHVSHEELAAHHHAVLYAVGSPTDRRLGIPGEDLPGSYPATAFVAWYNGHPDYRDAEFDLSGERAVVIGNGNVALDVARMLALTTAELEPTDIADHALESLAESRIREIVVLGRRGPAQAAYTNPELRELGELEDADIVVDPDEVVLDPASAAFLESESANVTARRNVEIVQGYAQKPLAGKPKRIVLRFLASPVEIVGSGGVEGVRVVHNELEATEGGYLAARPTERTETIEADIVLRSVGYRGAPLPGVPFDERRGTIHNTGGRVTDPETGEQLHGTYTAGWIKRGPSGVIGTNKKDAQETVDHLLDDMRAGLLPEPAGDEESLIELIRERRPEVVDYDAWSLIDEHERSLGEPAGRPRVKLTRLQEMLDVVAPQRR
ncbi:MAG: ferredoxin/flavodoxin---NADP+ reductase [Thermoleophilaceae bacterium]|nr:ferredoxin/flavodoxin---NADP+ reductase [Thermoleophilaceae bacterium]